MAALPVAHPVVRPVSLACRQGRLIALLLGGYGMVSCAVPAMRSRDARGAGGATGPEVHGPR